MLKRTNVLWSLVIVFLAILGIGFFGFNFARAEDNNLGYKNDEVIVKFKIFPLQTPCFPNYNDQQLLARSFAPYNSMNQY